jgi:Leucine-rich repeat (LRR) protein
MQLDLSHNQIDAIGAKKLSAALEISGSHLKCLNLSHNNLNYEGAQALFSAIYFCTRIDSLGLSNNFIKDEGCMAACEYLGLKKCSLKGLDISDNFITETSALNLLGMLDYFNEVDDDCYMIPSDEVLRNSSLTELDLSRNDIKSMKGAIKKAIYRRAFKIKITADDLR